MAVSPHGDKPAWWSHQSTYYSFIAALNDGNRKIEVMKLELVNTETALNCAVKREAIIGYSRYIDF